MTDQSQPLFLFGPGYSGQALAAIWDGPAFGSVRSAESRQKLAGTGVQPVGIDDPDTLQSALKGTHVVISAPPRDEGCPALKALADKVSAAESITYLSTTGVYGDLHGGWVMEWSPVSPGSPRATRRVKAEEAWAKACPDLRIVRLPGIYGPGRSAFDRLREGRARRIEKPGQVFSRIHVEDIASGLKALLTSKATGVFHLCDDEAAPPQDVIAYGAQLLGIQPPPLIPFEGADLSPMAKSFYSECKRVSNARVKAVTGWRPQYPTYRDGLRAILDLER